MERNEILIAEFMAIDVTDAILMIPAMIVVGGLGIVIGMYISSQIKCHIRRNIMNNNFKRYEDEQKKRKN